MTERRGKRLLATRGTESYRGKRAQGRALVVFLDAKSIDANRAVVRGELMTAGMPAVAADAWCAAWEAEAKRLNIDRRIADYWTLGSVWIREQMSNGRARS